MILTSGFQESGGSNATYTETVTHFVHCVVYCSPTFVIAPEASRVTPHSNQLLCTHANESDRAPSHPQSLQ